MPTNGDCSNTFMTTCMNSDASSREESDSCHSDGSENADDAMETGNSRANSHQQLDGILPNEREEPLPSDWNNSVPQLVKTEDHGGSGSSLQARGGGKGRSSRAQAKGMKGRFSGRLEAKSDEKLLVDECKLVGPMLGGAGKRGDQCRQTLAKIVRGIADGDIRRHCEAREAHIQDLTSQVQAMSGSDGGQMVEKLKEANRNLRAELNSARGQLQRYQIGSPSVEGVPQASTDDPKHHEDGNQRSGHHKQTNHRLPPPARQHAASTASLALSAQDLMPQSTLDHEPLPLLPDLPQSPDITRQAFPDFPPVTSMAAAAAQGQQQQQRQISTIGPVAAAQAAAAAAADAAGQGGHDARGATATPDTLKFHASTLKVHADNLHMHTSMVPTQPAQVQVAVKARSLHAQAESLEAQADAQTLQAHAQAHSQAHAAARSQAEALAAKADRHGQAQAEAADRLKRAASQSVGELLPNHFDDTGSEQMQKLADQAKLHAEAKARTIAIVHSLEDRAQEHALQAKNAHEQAQSLSQHAQTMQAKAQHLDARAQEIMDLELQTQQHQQQQQLVGHPLEMAMDQGQLHSLPQSLEPAILPISGRQLPKLARQTSFGSQGGILRRGVPDAQNLATQAAEAHDIAQRAAQAHMQAEAAAVTLTAAAAAAAASGESEGQSCQVEAPTGASLMESVHSLQHSTQGTGPLATLASPISGRESVQGGSSTAAQQGSAPGSLVGNSAVTMCRMPSLSTSATASVRSATMSTAGASLPPELLRQSSFQAASMQHHTQSRSPPNGALYATTGVATSASCEGGSSALLTNSGNRNPSPRPTMKEEAPSQVDGQHHHGSLSMPDFENPFRSMEIPGSDSGQVSDVRSLNLQQQQHELQQEQQELQQEGMLSSCEMEVTQPPLARRVSAGSVLQRHSGGGLPPPAPTHRMSAAMPTSSPTALRHVWSQSLEQQHHSQGRPPRSNSASLGMSPHMDSHPLPASAFNIMTQQQQQQHMGRFSSQPNMRHLSSEHLTLQSPHQHHHRQQLQQRQQLQHSASHHHLPSTSQYLLQATSQQETLDYQGSSAMEDHVMGLYSSDAPRMPNSLGHTRDDLAIDLPNLEQLMPVQSGGETLSPVVHFDGPVGTAAVEDLQFGGPSLKFS